MRERLIRNAQLRQRRKSTDRETTIRSRKDLLSNHIRILMHTYAIIYVYLCIRDFLHISVVIFIHLLNFANLFIVSKFISSNYNNILDSQRGIQYGVKRDSCTRGMHMERRGIPVLEEYNIE